MLVLGGILLVLLAIFIPFIFKQREMANRAHCADNLRQIANALNTYARDNDGAYPASRREAAIDGYVAFTGADSQSPFADDSSVRPNDVTASIWLLVSRAYLGTDTASAQRTLICPSTSDHLDAGATGGRSNFRSGSALSYSYCSPFSRERYFQFKADSVPPKFVVMADRNPGVLGQKDNVCVDADSDVFTLSLGNSNNHDKAGQNVLHTEGTVTWEKTPYCSSGGDNIYTAAAAKPLQGARPPMLNMPGVCGHDYAPAHAWDSYLVPTDDENDAADFSPPTAAPSVTKPADATSPSSASSAPATAPVTSPSTFPAGDDGLPAIP